VKLLKNLLLVAVSFSISLLLGEMVVRIISPQNLSGTWSIDSGTGYTLNKSNGSSKHQFGDRVVHYEYRPPHLRDMGINKGDYKILVLGDSYTFGWLIDSKDTYISHLQRFADKELGAGNVQFINGGAGGWGTADYVRFTEEFGDVINPDCILVFLNAWDIGRSIKRGFYRLKDDSGLDLEFISKGKDVEMVKLIITSLPGYQVLLENSHLFNFFRSSYLKLRYPKQTVISKARTVKVPLSAELEARQKYSQKLGHALFSRLKDWGSQRSIPLIVTTTNSFAFANQGKAEPTTAFFWKAPSIFEEEEIPFFDISVGVKDRSGGNLEQYIIPGDGHPNEAGALLIAKLVWPWLKPALQAAKSEEKEIAGTIDLQ
jgi:hypothetical protein